MNVELVELPELLAWAERHDVPVRVATSEVFRSRVVFANSGAESRMTRIADDADLEHVWLWQAARARRVVQTPGPPLRPGGSGPSPTDN